MSTLNYTTIHHETRKSLGLSANEYMIADLIYNLQNNPKSKHPGWCYASKDSLADTLGLTRNGIQKLVNKLVKLKLLERDGEQSHLRTTQDWYEKVVCINQPEGRIQRMQGAHTTYAGGAYKVTKNPGYNNNIYNNNENTPLPPEGGVLGDEQTPSSVNVNRESGPAEKRNTIGLIATEILEHYKKCSGKIRTRVIDKDKLATRLKTFSTEEIKQAITNAYADDFYSGKNDRQWSADLNDYILRNDSIIDKLMNLKPRRINASRVSVHK